MENRKRLYTLDILKFICAILIVLHHFQQVTNIRFNSFNFFGGDFYFGYLVELFFMISGFLCIYNYKNCESLFLYLHRRMRKIFPIALLSILLIYCVELLNYFLFGHPIKIDGLGIWTIFTSITLSFDLGIFSSTGLGINNPLWYLNVLMVCCAAFWLINKNENRFKYLYLFIPLISLGLQNTNISLPFITSFTLRGYTAFFIGVLLYFIYEKLKKHTNLKKIVLLLFVILGSIVSLGLINYYVFYDNIYYILVCLIYPILLFICVYLNKYLNIDKLKIFGNVSLEMYIWHAFLLRILETLRRFGIIDYLNNSLLLMIVFVICTIVFALIIVLFFEDRIQKLFQKIANNFLKHDA